jgi:hypothetical protein
MALRSKNALTHDEAISYLVATGHKAEFSEVVKDESPPYGVWAEARRWKRFTRVEDVLCFGKIRHDLRTTDLHPPMYFWLLHVWCLVAGIDVRTGGRLNLIIVVITALALFGLARHILRDPVRAALVVFIWSVSATVIPIALVARHYDLLALAAVLFGWQVIRCVDAAQPLGRTQWILLALATAFGLLTHYHFPLIVVGCGLFALFRLVKRRRRRFLAMCTSVLVGALVFIALNPGFYDSIKAGRQRAQAFGSEPIGRRVDRTVGRYTAFFVDSASLPVSNRRTAAYGVLIGLAGLSLFVAGRELLRRLVVGPSPGDRGLNSLYIVYIFLWTAGTNVLLYLTFISPKHAMEPKYPAMVWPFFAFVPVLLLGTFRKMGMVLTVALGVGMLVAGWLEVLHVAEFNQRAQEPVALFEQARQVVVDNVERPILPRVLWHCPDEMMVFAASPQYLLDRTDAWDDVFSPNTLYVTPPGRGDSNEKRKRIIRLIAETHEIHRIKGWFWNLGASFWISGKR